MAQHGSCAMTIIPNQGWKRHMYSRSDYPNECIHTMATGISTSLWHVSLYTTWFPKTAEEVLGVAIESSYYPIYPGRHDRTCEVLLKAFPLSTSSFLLKMPPLIIIATFANILDRVNASQHQGFLMKKYWEPTRDWRRLNQLYELMCHQGQQQEIHSIICAENQRCANEK